MRVCVCVLTLTQYVTPLEIDYSFVCLCKCLHPVCCVCTAKGALSQLHCAITKLETCKRLFFICTVHITRLCIMFLALTVLLHVVICIVCL